MKRLISLLLILGMALPAQGMLAQKKPTLWPQICGGIGAGIVLISTLAMRYSQKKETNFENDLKILNGLKDHVDSGEKIEASLANLLSDKSLRIDIENNISSYNSSREREGNQRVQKFNQLLTTKIQELKHSSKESEGDKGEALLYGLFGIAITLASIATHYYKKFKYS